MFGRTGFRAFRASSWRFGRSTSPRWMHMGPKRPIPRRVSASGWSVFEDLKLVSFGSHLIFFMLLPPFIKEYTTKIDVVREDAPPELGLGEYGLLANYIRQRPFEKVSFLQPGLLEKPATKQDTPCDVDSAVLSFPSTPDELTECIGVPIYLENTNLSVPKEIDELPRRLVSKLKNPGGNTSLPRKYQERQRLVRHYRMQPYAVGDQNDPANVYLQLEENYNRLTNSQQSSLKYVLNLSRIIEMYLSRTTSYQTESNEIFKVVFTQLYDLELYSLAQVLIEVVLTTPMDDKSRALKSAQKAHMEITQRFLKTKAKGERIIMAKSKLRGKVGQSSLKIYNHRWVEFILKDVGLLTKVVDLWTRLETDPKSLLNELLGIDKGSGLSADELLKIQDVLVRGGHRDLAQKFAKRLQN
ncbi:hypothetical protein KL930_004780 [Ogataea haglerorum]|nr:hypothetical protein KL951_004674 [Ogataea haglerorum]KAG7714380.1 hypothetical protein KL913_004577 [Ogataea haglerorum]KAG7715067.1 hypothetical protein KL949_004460 [Ogataea haglerorum]KAG7727816.1 hypothetical protein KL948_004343 [Ogataea haglerorum]KAG7735670.1 hypothetical protein KL932_004334 [Ogataea haglerorum]